MPRSPAPSTISVVIPCYNEAAYLPRTLDSLRRQTFRGRVEVVVVDNGSTDGTAGIAAGRGARVLSEPRRGVCRARQAGTTASVGDVVVSTDADTTMPPDWLARIACAFAADERIVAVAGPCRFADGPLWARAHGRLLFGLVRLLYAATGRVVYVSATNIAFRRRDWPGYDVRLTQGGDELDLLRRLRRVGRVCYDHANPTFTSGRRLSRGLVYSVFVNTLVHYLLTYWVNRLSGRTVMRSAPAFRDDAPPLRRRLRTVLLAGAGAALVLLCSASTRHYLSGGVVAAAAGAGWWLLMSPRSQLLGSYPYRGDGSRPVVALTFDDGPNEPYTSQLLDVLARLRVRATFFQVGACVQRFPQSTARVAAAGHVIGNHALTHTFRTYLRPARFEWEVRRTQEILRDRLGRVPALCRTPWLWRHPALLRMLRRNALQPVSGDFCHAFEVFQPPAARIARRAVARTRPGSILIFHDGFDARGGDRTRTVQAVELTVRALRQRGYRFVTVDELLGVPAYRD
jgi:peptidoglycan/xylan/chitin deacetylase (PgdA/CDA1 family)/glycosyltransferase involved in cell wall biosynthesis